MDTLSYEIHGWTREMSKILENQHVWNIDVFPCSGGSGTVQYGDSLEDLWFIVLLLLRLSREYPHVYIHLTDSDGQFLLIEACDYIPRDWTPENTLDRVYLHAGNLVFIPFEFGPREFERHVVLDEKVQEAAFAQCGEPVYHFKSLDVPLKVASMLKRDRRWLTRAFNAIPSKKRADLGPNVRASICFTRASYVKALPDPASFLVQAFSNLYFDDDAFREQVDLCAERGPFDQVPDSNEDWLNLTPKELEQLKKGFVLDDSDEDDFDSLNSEDEKLRDELFDSFSKFTFKQSDYSGVDLSEQADTTPDFEFDSEEESELDDDEYVKVLKRNVKRGDKRFHETMADMDQELEFRLDSQVDPENLEFNFIENLLKSIESQGGERGPATTLFTSLGYNLQ